MSAASDSGSFLKGPCLGNREVVLDLKCQTEGRRTLFCWQWGAMEGSGARERSVCPKDTGFLSHDTGYLPEEPTG